MRRVKRRKRSRSEKTEEDRKRRGEEREEREEEKVPIREERRGGVGIGGGGDPHDTEEHLIYSGQRRGGRRGVDCVRHGAFSVMDSGLEGFYFEAWTVSRHSRHCAIHHDHRDTSHPACATPTKKKKKMCPALYRCPSVRRVYSCHADARGGASPGCHKRWS